MSCDDGEADVRLVAGECINKIIKVRCGHSKPGTIILGLEDCVIFEFLDHLQFLNKINAEIIVFREFEHLFLNQ